MPGCGCAGCCPARRPGDAPPLTRSFAACLASAIEVPLAQVGCAGSTYRRPSRGGGAGWPVAGSGWCRLPGLSASTGPGTGSGSIDTEGRSGRGADVRHPGWGRAQPLEPSLGRPGGPGSAGAAGLRRRRVRPRAAAARQRSRTFGERSPRSPWRTRQRGRCGWSSRRTRSRDGGWPGTGTRRRPGTFTPAGGCRLGVRPHAHRSRGPGRAGAAGSRPTRVRRGPTKCRHPWDRPQRTGRPPLSHRGGRVHGAAPVRAVRTPRALDHQGRAPRVDPPWRPPRGRHERRPNRDRSRIETIRLSIICLSEKATINVV